MASSVVVKPLACAAALGTVLILVPLFGGDFRAYQVGLFLLYGLAAQGLALTWGVAGFLSLGQAVFFGMGAYASGWVLKAAVVAPGWYAAWPLAVLLPAGLAYAVARMLFRGRADSGPFFSLTTLALSMLAFLAANQWVSVTGGFNGLGDIPELPALDRYGAMYLLIAAVVVLVTAALVWLNGTPFATLLSAVAQNEARLQCFGFATDRLKAAAFSIAAALAALAGALYAPQQGLVTPQAASVQLSTELLVWTAVGGRGSPFGALVGAVGIGLLSAELRERFVYWEAMVAVLFIIVVLRFPGGLWAGIVHAGQRLLRPGAARVTSRTEPGHGAAASLLAPVYRRMAGEEAAAVLQFQQVRVQAGGVRILDGLDLSVAQPGMHCVIGPNGAGKTSTFNTLTGRLPLTDGHIVLFGRPLQQATPVSVALHGVGRKFQVPSVFPLTTVQDNLDIALWAARTTWRDWLRGSIRHADTPMRRLMRAEFPFLDALSGQPAGALSQGQRQMLELAMAVLPEPRLLLLDEPCAGLSPEETQQQIAVALKAVAALQATALVIEHDMNAVERMAEQVHVLHQGRLLASGTLAQIQADGAVQAVYAGGRK